MKLTKEQGRACLAMMREIADGACTTRIERDAVHDALVAIGWMDRDPQDYFTYTDGCINCGTQYAEKQVLTALAFCVALSELPSHDTEPRKP